MKITKERVQQIIAEEIQKLKEEEEQPAMGEEPEVVKLTVSKLRAALKDLARDSAKFKGLDNIEATMIADIISRIMVKSQETSATSILKRVNVALERLKI